MFKQVLFYILSLLFFKKEFDYVPWYIINTPYIPQQIDWIDESNILLSSYGYTAIFNTDNRNSSTFDTCNECIYGYDKGFIYCKYEHRDIQAINEFSSTVSLYNINNSLIYSIDIFETVIPITCKKTFIELKVAHPYLQQKRFLLFTKQNLLKNIPDIQGDNRLNGIEESYTILSKRDDLERIIVLDEYMRLWVYRKKKN
jgi:hypothetical protein